MNFRDSLKQKRQLKSNPTTNQDSIKGIIKSTSKMTLESNKNRSKSNSITNTYSNNENLVGGRYEVKHKLGEGSFGVVRAAVDLKTNKAVAIKFEHKSDLKKHLLTESKVYTVVKGTGFVSMYWFGKHGDYTALVMDRLGTSLKDLYSKCNRIFPVATVALIAIQLLDRLEQLHGSGWLHQDIKPENIVIGTGSNKTKTILYLIDYGTSDQYIDPQTKQHRNRAPSTKIVGTARYSSLSNHYGYKQSRRDDLESLAYTLIYWLLGRLPWQGIDEKDFRVKWKKVRRIKRAITPAELCRGLPVQFKTYLNYVFKLSYNEKPNYGYLRGLFRQLIPTDITKARFAWEKFNIN